MRRRSLFENSIFANKHSDRGRRKGLVSGEDDARLGLLQVALQAAATHWCQIRIQRWTDNGSVDKYAKHLHKIVRQSRKSSGACVTDRLIPSLERPNVAKRWRIITQKQGWWRQS